MNIVVHDNSLPIIPILFLFSQYTDYSKKYSDIISAGLITMYILYCSMLYDIQNNGKYISWKHMVRVYYG